MSSKQERVDHYAQAVWQATLERYNNAIDAASKVLSSDKKLIAVLADSKAPASDKAAALDKALPTDTPAEISNLIKVMAEANDLELLGEVADRIDQVSTGKLTVLKAEVTSAIKLTEKEQTQIRARLVEEHGEDLVFTFTVDPALLGGLRVRVGDHLVDNSVASRLSALRESLTSVVR